MAIFDCLGETGERRWPSGVSSQGSHFRGIQYLVTSNSLVAGEDKMTNGKCLSPPTKACCRLPTAYRPLSLQGLFNLSQGQFITKSLCRNFILL